MCKFVGTRLNLSKTALAIPATLAFAVQEKLFHLFQSETLFDFIYILSELRKEARQLENELEMKLVSFSKLGTGQLRDFGKDGCVVCSKTLLRKDNFASTL